LLLRSLRNAQATDPGFDPRSAFAMDFDLDLKGLSEEQGKRFYATMVERVGALPGVRSAALANRAPLDISTPTIGVSVEGHSPPPGRDTIPVSFYRVSPDYFRTTAVALMSGRELTERDVKDSPGVVVINETMARRFWPGEEPVGKSFRMPDEGAKDGGAGRIVEVVGVARDAKYRTLGEDPTPHMYLPFLQSYEAAMTLLVRTEGDERRLMGAVRGELLKLDKDPQGFFARTLEEHVGVAKAPGRVAAALFGLFGLLALVLAAIGVYGVTAYSVSRRTREIGVRMALGAREGDVMKLVLGRGMLVCLTGVGTGLIAALALTRFLSGLLLGVSTTDPLTFVAVPALLTVVALLACYIPARRATKVDPMVALRYE
ncbi:MAG: FtsX-like permease family protein, partial [Pyrinomonadaceae bacterium]